MKQKRQRKSQLCWSTFSKSPWGSTCIVLANTVCSGSWSQNAFQKPQKARQTEENHQAFPDFSCSLTHHLFLSARLAQWLGVSANSVYSQDAVQSDSKQNGKPYLRFSLQRTLLSVASCCELDTWIFVAAFSSNFVQSSLR